MNAWKIVNKYDTVIRNFYEGLLIGCMNKSYTRLYLDLHSSEIFQNVEASCNAWLHREDESLAEIAHDNGVGSNLSDDDFEYLKKYGVSDFGFEDWLDGYLIPNIEQALADWKDKQCKK